MFQTNTATMVVAATLSGIMWASPDIAGGPTGDDPQDGVVNALDLVALLAVWGPCTDTCGRGDINRDRVVDIDDLTIMLNLVGDYDPRTFIRCRTGHDPGSPPA